MNKNGVICVLILLLLCTLHQQIPNFLLLKTEENSKWTSITTENDIESAKEILQKPLRFLGAGSQCYAFLSEDKNYVVKICKASRYKSFLGKKNIANQEKDFLSYHLAFTLIPAQSQMTFLHLSRTSTLNTTIKIIDPLGFPHFFNADHLAFYIQKKATPLSNYLKNLPDSEVSSLTEKLLDLFKSSCQAGLQIRDIHPKNIGIYKEAPIWIDPGRIKKNTSLLNKEKQEIKLHKFRSRIELFIRDCNPSLQNTSPNVFYNSD